MPVQEKWRYDRRLTATMVDDFTHDPCLGGKVLLGLKEIPPHQQLRIVMMWVTKYTQDDSGFTTGKSFTHAIVSALRSIIFEGRISGVLSGTFRQGKLIFQNYETWYNNSSIFRSCIKHRNGKERIVRDQECHQVHFRGGSQIRVLPPNFLQDSVRLQSERWHDGYFDEWPTFNIQSLTKTLFGRVTHVNEYMDCPIRGNHVHLCGTPRFKHDPAYKLTRKLDEMIAKGSKKRARFTCNYRHIPRTAKYRSFVDLDMIHTMQTMNPKGVVETEINGIWADDSLSFYSSKYISGVRASEPFCLMLRRSPDEAYVGGFDVARGGSDDLRSSGGDDFAMSVFRVSMIDPPVHVFTFRRNDLTAEQQAGLVQWIHGLFGLSLIVYDPGGGGLFVRDELQKEHLPIMSEMKKVTPLLNMDDATGTIGDRILIPFRRTTPWISLFWGKMASDSVLVNRLHNLMKSAIEKSSIHFGSRWNKWDHDGKDWDSDAMRAWLNNNVGLKMEERVKAEMDLAVTQLISVDVARDKGTNNPILDSFGMMKFESIHKKDSAYSLVYSNLAYELWRYAHKNGLMSGSFGGQSSASLSVGYM